MYATVQDLVLERAWAAGKGLSAFDSSVNYSGPSHAGWVLGLTQTRDADALTRANFSALLDLLGGESDTVQVNRLGHWACGWAEQILVDASDTARLEILRDALNALADYPVLDDSAFCDEEQADKELTFDNYRTDFVRAVAAFLGAEDELDEVYGGAAVTNVLWLLYEEDCAYRGVEDGFVHEDGIAPACARARAEFTRLARGGNKLARHVMRQAGVAFTPKRRA